MYTIVMVGTDIVYIPRVVLKQSFIDYVLTEDERVMCEKIHLDKRKKEFVAGRIACKEAIFKATQDKEYLSYSILNTSNGKPYVKDHPEIEISISHDQDYALAFVIIQSIS